MVLFHARRRQLGCSCWQHECALGIDRSPWCRAPLSWFLPARLLIGSIDRDLSAEVSSVFVMIMASRTDYQTRLTDHTQTSARVTFATKCVENFASATRITAARRARTCRIVDRIAGATGQYLSFRARHFFAKDCKGCAAASKTIATCSHQQRRRPAGQGELSAT